MACRRADIVAGPVGIVVADSMLGEVTGRMAAAVARAGEARVLIPFNRCETIVAGVADRPLSELVEDAAARVAAVARRLTGKHPAFGSDTELDS